MEIDYKQDDVSPKMIEAGARMVQSLRGDKSDAYIAEHVYRTMMLVHGAEVYEAQRRAKRLERINLLSV